MSPDVVAKKRQQQVASLRAMGKTLSEIGEEIGVSRSYAWHLLRVASPTRASLREDATRQRLRVVDLRQEGKTLREIGAAMGFSEGRARQLIRRAQRLGEIA
jgi:DNA-binding CsgD family transcriptional regulator